MKSDLTRMSGRFVCLSRYTKFFATMIFKVLLGDTDDKKIVGTFSVPFRPHLIHKAKPALVNLSRKALENDEVFLILILIYSEAKRQEGSVCFFLSLEDAMSKRPQNFGPVAGAGA